MTRELQENIRLLRDLDAGHLDALVCPACSAHSVSVWFSQPVEDEYRTWFLCDKCDFSLRVQNAHRPELYSESRVKADLQDYDRELLMKLRLKNDSE